MRKIHTKTIRGLALSASALALTAGSQAYAQDADCPTGQEEVDGECVIQSDGPDGVTSNSPAADDVVDVTDTGATGQNSAGAIVVTGSRIKRDTYSSISPLQILTTETAQDTGVFDPSQILQRDESASGQQFDATFQGFVLNNGPGSQTLNLRGLGADRTLLLINGRRMAPAGVEGAPTNPSINLLPSSLIDRYDLLLDGASSVYGSDAVAGVGNIVMRKDFDGLELFASGNLNPNGGGDDYQVSAAWGYNDDRTFIGIGAEYSYRDEVKLRDRDFLSGCDTHYEVTDSGEIRTVDVATDAVYRELTNGAVGTQADNSCKITGQIGRIISPYQTYGSVYYTPGPGNSGIPNFDESSARGLPVDADGDGLADVDFFAIDRNGGNPDLTFISTQKQYSVMAYGETVLPGAANITPFFEAMYVKADIRSPNSGAFQFFPYAPDINAFNPCNFVTNPNGVDCAAAETTLLGRPGANSGIPLPVRPVVSVRGDRANYEVEQQQFRIVGGVRADLPFIGSSWTGEFATTWSRSEGKAQRVGIREDKIAFALGIDPTADYDGDGIVDNIGNGIADDWVDTPLFGIFGDPRVITPCDASALANPDLAAPGLLDGCVPVNLFTPNLLGQIIGDFDTQAERDYVFGVRDFDTTYEQITIGGFVTGDLFELPAGNVAAVVGLEWREDRLDSNPGFVASDGLFFGYFSDQGAKGSKWIREAYGELDIPLQANKPWVRELTVNLSGRLTDEEFYGTAGTYSVKAGWRPIDPLLLKFSYGTSFRAPNLRENFLRGQSGFLTLVDPCAVPDDAYATGTYDATQDDRDPSILANCLREGRDPTVVGTDAIIGNSIQTSSVEIATGGSLDLNEETSRSLTAGFAFEETFGDGFDVALGMNYYDIKIKGAIVEPSTQFIINDCFTRQDGQRSQFCDRIVTGGSNDRFLITDVNSGFINLNQESVRGFDFNGFFGKEVNLFGSLVDLGLTLRANHLVERSNVFIDDSGNATIDEDAGEFGFPSWTGRAIFNADYDNWRLTWQTRWIGEVEQQEDGIDPLSDAFGYGPDGEFTGFFGDTCLGGGSRDADGTPNGIVAGDGVYCRDIGYADDWFEHTISLRYRADTWEARVGVTNLFDKNPPLIDTNEVFGVSNTPIGNGYNLDGREFFASISYEF